MIFTPPSLWKSLARSTTKGIWKIRTLKSWANPSCGDEITLQIKLDGDVLKDLSYTGEGCAISQAYTSIMIDTVRGKTRDEAVHLADTFIGMIKGVSLTEEEEDALEDAMAFEGISKLPARVKCAVLPWYTLKNTLEK